MTACVEIVDAPLSTSVMVDHQDIEAGDHALNIQGVTSMQYRLALIEDLRLITPRQPVLR